MGTHIINIMILHDKSVSYKEVPVSHIADVLQELLKLQVSGQRGPGKWASREGPLAHLPSHPHHMGDIKTC